MKAPRLVAVLVCGAASAACVTAPTPRCQKDLDCAAGQVCDLEVGTCGPAWSQEASSSSLEASSAANPALSSTQGTSQDSSGASSEAGASTADGVSHGASSISPQGSSRASSSAAASTASRAPSSAVDAPDAGPQWPLCQNPRDSWRAGPGASEGACVRTSYSCAATTACDQGYTCNANHECACPDGDVLCGVRCSEARPVCPSYRPRCRRDGQCRPPVSDLCLFPSECGVDGGMCDGLSATCITPGALAGGAVCQSSSQCGSGLCALETCLDPCGVSTACAAPLFCAVMGPTGANGCVLPGDAGPPAFLGPGCAQRNDECAYDAGMRCVLELGPGCALAPLGQCSLAETTQTQGVPLWTDAGTWVDEEVCTARQKCLENVDCAAPWNECRVLGTAGQKYCVRTAAGESQLEFPRWTPPPDHPTGYTFDADTVLDRVTHLTWQRTAASITPGWAGARAYCAALSLAGNAKWRLPTLTELESLVDYTLTLPTLNRGAFPGAATGAYWTASPSLDPNVALLVDFNYGRCTTYGSSNATPAHVRCVR